MKATSTKIISLLPSILVFALFSFLIITPVFAQTPNYVPIIGLPGLQNLDKNTTIPDYLNAIYVILIILGSIIGVLKIAYAGVKYSLSDIVSDKGSAIASIKGVLLGLALLLLPYVVLNTINPDLVNLDILRIGNEVKVNLKTGSSPQTAVQQPAYQNTDLEKVGSTIKTDSVAGKTETLIPVGTGTLDELGNMRSQCVVNVGPDYNFYKDPERNVYVCKSK